MAIAGRLEVLLTSNLKGLLGGLNQAKGAVSKFSTGTTGALGKVNAAFNSLAAVAKIAGVGLAAGLAFSVKKAFDFEKEMVNVKAVANATGEEFIQLQKHAREMGATTIFSASEAAKGMYSLASAGFSAGEIMDSTRAVLDLATATQSDLSLVTETVTANIRAFGLQASDSARVSNVFAAAISKSRLNMQRVADAMKFAAPTGKLLGQTLEKTTAVIAALADQGLSASQAGTTFRMAMVRLLKPSEEAKAILEENGVTMELLAEKMHDPVELFELLSQAELSNSEAATVMGTRSLSMMNIVRDGIPRVKELTEAITGTTRASDIAAEQQQTLWGQFKLMKSAIEDAAITIGNQLLPYLKIATAAVREWVAGLQETGEVKAFAERIVAMGKALFEWLKPFGLMIKMFAKFAAKYPIIVTGILAIWGALQLLQFHPVIAGLTAIIALITVASRIFGDYRDKVNAAAQAHRNMKLVLVDDIEKKKALAAEQKKLIKSIVDLRVEMLQYASSSKKAAVNEDDAIESINNMNDEMKEQVTRLEEVDREYLSVIERLHDGEKGFDKMRESASGMATVLKTVQKRIGGLNEVTGKSAGAFKLQGSVADDAADRMKLLAIRFKDVKTTVEKTNTVIDVYARNLQKTINKAENYGRALQSLTGLDKARGSAIASLSVKEAKNWKYKEQLAKDFFDNTGAAMRAQFREEQANAAQVKLLYLKQKQELEKIESRKRTAIQEAEVKWLDRRIALLRGHQERLKNMNMEEKEDFINLLNSKAEAQAQHEQILEEFSTLAMESFSTAVEIRGELRDAELAKELERINIQRAAEIETSASRTALVEFDKAQDAKRSSDKLALMKKELAQAIKDGDIETIEQKKDEIAQFHEEKRISAERAKLVDAAKLEEERINDEFDAKERKVKTEKARADKRWAVIESTIATAVAVTKLLATPPLAVAAGIAGAAKTAFIAGRPLPQFDEGGAVPGARGSPQLIQAEGGETILPTHKMSLSNALTSVLGRISSFQDGRVVGGGNVSAGDIVIGEGAFVIQAPGVDAESMREVTREAIIPELENYARERGTELLS